MFLANSCSLVGPLSLHICPLSRDPFTDIRRTIPELSLVVLDQRKELHSFTVDERHVLEIDDQCTGFLSQHIAERLHMFPGKAPTYAQHNAIAAFNDPVDSAAHYFG
jgi:hypothetical protein